MNYFWIFLKLCISEFSSCFNQLFSSFPFSGLSIVNGTLSESIEPYSAAWDIAMISVSDQISVLIIIIQLSLFIFQVTIVYG